MDQFVSTFTNKLDAKGRVSVPAVFRAILAKDGFEGVYCYPSLDDDALDAGGQRLVNKIQNLLEDLAPYSDERDHLAMALFGASEVLSLDQDGRIVLPGRFIDYANIDNRVTFVGLGEKFQLWETGRFEAQFAQGRQELSKLKILLGTGMQDSGSATKEQE